MATIYLENVVSATEMFWQWTTFPWKSRMGAYNPAWTIRLRQDHYPEDDRRPGRAHQWYHQD